MKLDPRPLPVGNASQPPGIVLVLHGGASRRENTPVNPAQHSVPPMIPITRRIARNSAGKLAVLPLLNSRREPETAHTPVHNLRWALDHTPNTLHQRLPARRIGHSLDRRAAPPAAGKPTIAGAVAPAP